MDVKCRLRRQEGARNLPFPIQVSRGPGQIPTGRSESDDEKENMIYTWHDPRRGSLDAGS
jgi:hypothetical protein